MKKTLLTFLLFFATNILFSQIIMTIYDQENDEVYGYLSYEELERIDRNSSRYLIHLIDVNLNPIAQTTFTDKKKLELGLVRYNGTSIYIEFLGKDTEIINKSSLEFGYRIYDLENNVLSNRYEVPKRFQNKDIGIVDSYSIPNKGYGINIIDYKNRTNTFYAISNDNETLYEANIYIPEKKERNLLNIRVQDIYGNRLASIVKNYPHKRSEYPTYSVLLTDLNTGEIKNEIVFNNDDYKANIYNVQFNDNNVHVFGDTYRGNKKVKLGKTTGMMKATLDMDGNLISQNNVTWADLESKIDIKEGGRVKGNGFIHTLDYVYDKTTKHTIVVGGYIKREPLGVAAKDIVFLDFDKDFNLHQVFEVETRKDLLQMGVLSSWNPRDYGLILEAGGFFDYRFNMFLEEQNGLMFFYKSYNRVSLTKMDLVHGVVIFKDKKFTDNRLSWEKVKYNDKTQILPSKPGYILISEQTKNNKMENRLERIAF